MHSNQNTKTMRDLNDPNNPEYQDEEDLTLSFVLGTLPAEYCEVIEDEIQIRQIDSENTRKRIVNIRKEISNLIEVLEQTEQTFTLNRLKKILEL